ncbi:helix-turn-helix domain-containing protein [Streptomyces sp. NPDC005336]|uniref:PucR family transcriptional regulator n=1 Tax=Streptomyces sp. NPDC005336 TaxID=3157035 RepID=UPI0033A6A38C
MMEPVDMQAAVDRLAAEVGQSVLIEDVDQHPVWWSTKGAVDGTRMKTILDRRVEPPAAAVVQRLRLAQATAPVRTPAMPQVDMWARWCMPVRYEGGLLGFLWVLDPEETVTEADLPALVDCAELAAEAMVKTRETADQRRRLRGELVERLLAALDQNAARELIRLEHLPSDARVQVEDPGKAGGWPLPNDMSAHVAGSRVRTATSGSPVPLVELGEAVRRAVATRRAVTAGARLDPVSWDGLGAWRLIVEAPDSLTVAQLHPGAEILTRRPHADLMTTARAVLDHGGGIAAAAAELHVHRTTLYYRLDRITELTGVDLRAGFTRTNLQLALWLAAYRRAAA